MSNFDRKINKLLVRIFQQGWYFYDQKTKFSENEKKNDIEIFIAYTL